MIRADRKNRPERVVGWLGSRMKGLWRRVFKRRRMILEMHSLLENVSEQMVELGNVRYVVDYEGITNGLEEIRNKIVKIGELSFNHDEFLKKLQKVEENLSKLIDINYANHARYIRIERNMDPIGKKLDAVLNKLDQLGQVEAEGTTKRINTEDTTKHPDEPISVLGEFSKTTKLYKDGTPITIRDCVEALDAVISIMTIRLATRPDLYQEHAKNIEVLKSIAEPFNKKLDCIDPSWRG